RDRRVGVRGEGFEQPEPRQELAGGRARAPRRDRALGELALDRPGVEPRDPDGRRAGAREEKRHHEGAAAPASPLRRIAPPPPARAQATESTGLDARESTESCSNSHDSIALCSRGPEEDRVGTPAAASWLLLIHQIPPRPNYFRVRIGRRLQRL